MRGSTEQTQAVITRPALHSAEELAVRLESAIEAHGLRIAAKIDHAENARRAGTAMPPATVFIFGNPKNGTPLLLAAPTLALELPLRMLAWEDGNGMAFLSYVDPRSFAEPYALAGYFGTLQAMADLLDAIAQDAADGI